MGDEKDERASVKDCINVNWQTVDSLKYEKEFAEDIPDSLGKFMLSGTLSPGEVELFGVNVGIPSPEEYDDLIAEAVEIAKNTDKMMVETDCGRNLEPAQTPISDKISGRYEGIGS
jgi:hypothetical protein